MLKRIVMVALVIASIMCSVACSDDSENAKSINDVGYLPNISDEDIQNVAIYFDLDMKCSDDEIPQVQSGKKHMLADEDVQRFQEFFDMSVMGELPAYTYTFDILIDMGSEKLMIDTSSDMAYYVEDNDKIKVLVMKLSDEQKTFIEGLAEAYNKADK